MENKDHGLIKECIFTALTLLMEQKDFHDITITEITQKAGVSRMSYYRCYSSKEDILIQYFDEMADQLIGQFKEQPEITPYHLCCEFFTFFHEHEALVENLAKANLAKLMLEHFSRYLKELYQSVPAETTADAPRQTLWPPKEEGAIPSAYQIHYHTGGLFTLLLYWIDGGLKETPEEMASIAISMVIP